MRSLPLLALFAAAPALAQPLAISSPNPDSYGRFGYALSAVPDADGDGRRDFLVGAGLENGGPFDGTGRAYLYSGATGELLRTLESPLAQGLGSFGFAVAGVEDVDDDGRGDLLVTAPFDEQGRAYLFSGSSGALLRTLESPDIQSGAEFGCSAAGVEDTDGDGVDDLLIGARLEDAGATAAGRAYLFSGATGGLLHTLESPTPEYLGRFGCSVSGVADANGDGRGDLLVGADNEDTDGDFDPFDDQGRAYLFSGATGALLLALQSPDPTGRGLFGRAVAGAADADGDGRGELLVGAPGEGVGRGGRAHLYSGATGALLRTLESPNSDFLGGFGYAVAGLPDVDGDGRDDFGVGAPGEGLDGSADAGRAYVFSGATGARLYALRSPNAEPSGFFGSGGVGLGDVDGDGRGDGVVAAEEEDVGGLESAGRVYLYRTGRSGGSWVAEDVAVAAEAPSERPTTFALSASPNPFASSTAIRLALPRPAEAAVEVLDVLGRRVALVHEGALTAGAHALRWAPAAGVPGGVYLLRLRVAGEPALTARVTLAR